MTESYIGVMSGTSLDGIDVALCEIDDETCVLKASLEYPFDEELKKRILKVIDSNTTLYELGKIDHDLALLFADSINLLLKQENINSNDIKAVGLHGQTMWHEASIFSMQLGDASIVSVKTGIDVVSDFRRKDMALGGQGAPFAPAFHEFIFKKLYKTCVVNIGGISNITLLGESLSGYDIGSGNVLLDFWINKHQNKAYDKDGLWAKSGSVHKELLFNLLSEEYFALEAPKSTGRELFNEAWLNIHMCKFSTIKPQDIQATLLELTAQSIKNEIIKYSLELVLICGGGSKNSFLMQRLKELLPNLKVVATDEYGASSDFLEAMAFAWFAKKRVHKEKVNLRSVTGSSKNSVLGAIYAKG